MIKWLWALAYILSVLLANVFVAHFGIVKVLGLMFPAGVVWVGLTLHFVILLNDTGECGRFGYL